MIKKTYLNKLMEKILPHNLIFYLNQQLFRVKINKIKIFINI